MFRKEDFVDIKCEIFTPNQQCFIHSYTVRTIAGVDMGRKIVSLIIDAEGLCECVGG